MSARFIRTDAPARIAHVICTSIACSLFPAERSMANAIEQFNYASSLQVNGLNGGVGWTGPWTAGPPASTGFFTLLYPLALPPVGVAARTNDSVVLKRELHPAIGAIDAVTRPWMSFMLERDTTNFSMLKMDGLLVDPVRIMVFPGGTITLSYGVDPPATSTVSSSGSGATDFLIMHLKPGMIELWLNPVGPLGAANASVPAPINVNYGNVEFTLDIAQTLDEIRTGTALNEVSVLAGQGGCPGDINGDNAVNAADMLAVINSWGTCPAPPAACPADIAPAVHDGFVNSADLLAVINGWGSCPP